MRQSWETNVHRRSTRVRENWTITLPVVKLFSNDCLVLRFVYPKEILTCHGAYYLRSEVLENLSYTTKPLRQFLYNWVADNFGKK